MLCLVTLHVWDDIPPNLLARLLKDSPKLQELVYVSDKDNYDDFEFPWNQPSTVPKCFCPVYKSSPGQNT
ncbi:hypothetical protein AtEden1_Chr4g0283821 [Arabidopsis thaliana]